jgi:hypothetical protein
MIGNSDCLEIPVLEVPKKELRSNKYPFRLLS